jgi:hypothetical protein
MPRTTRMVEVDDVFQDRVKIANHGSSTGVDGNGILWSIHEVPAGQACESCGLRRMGAAWCAGSRVRCGNCVDYGASTPHRLH